MSPDPLVTPVARRWFVALGSLILLLAAVWRLVLAEALTTVSPDGALYLEYARDFARSGWSLLARQPLEQHPLFPGSIAFVGRALLGFGWTDQPDTWVRAGQVVTVTTGVALVLAIGLVAGTISRALRQPPVPAMLVTMTLAALLPLNTWHSADVMSDQMHALWLALGVTAAAWLPRTRAALAVGCCAALAFLTRPEGAGLVIAAVVALAVMPRATPAARCRAGAVIALVAAALVAPYWLTSGGLSPKLHKETTEQVQVAVRAAPRFATLTRHDLDWYEAPAKASLEFLRAGRVVVPVLAVIGMLVALRRRRTAWRLPAIVTPLALAALILAAAQVLVVRHGYLAPRHLLVPTNLAVAAAGLTIAGLLRRTRPGGAVLLVLAALPLAAYSTRVPNGADAHLAELGRWLAQQPRPGQALLLGGASERRIAFYGQVRFQAWPENLQDPEVRLRELHGHLVGFSATHFALTLGSTADLAANRGLLQRLRARWPGLLSPLREMPIDRGRTLVLFTVDSAAG